MNSFEKYTSIIIFLNGNILALYQLNVQKCKSSLSKLQKLILELKQRYKSWQIYCQIHSLKKVMGAICHHNKTLMIGCYSFFWLVYTEKAPKSNIFKYSVRDHCIILTRKTHAFRKTGFREVLKVDFWYLKMKHSPKKSIKCPLFYEIYVQSNLQHAIYSL